jgi:hypothetical protein
MKNKFKFKSIQYKLEIYTHANTAYYYNERQIWVLNENDKQRCDEAMWEDSR